MKKYRYVQYFLIVDQNLYLFGLGFEGVRDFILGFLGPAAGVVAAVESGSVSVSALKAPSENSPSASSPLCGGTGGWSSVAMAAAVFFLLFLAAALYLKKDKK